MKRQTTSASGVPVIRHSRRLLKKKELREKLADQKARRKARKQKQREMQQRKQEEREPKSNHRKQRRPRTKPHADEPVMDFWIDPTISPNPKGTSPPLAELHGVCMRPGLKGVQTAGSLVAHARGLTFTALGGDSIHVLYRSVRHAFFLPFDESTNERVLLHFHFHATTRLRSKTKDIQFYAKKIPGSESYSGRRKNRLDSSINKEFRSFIRTVRRITAEQRAGGYNPMSPSSPPNASDSTDTGHLPTAKRRRLAISADDAEAGDQQTPSDGATTDNVGEVRKGDNETPAVSAQPLVAESPEQPQPCRYSLRRMGSPPKQSLRKHRNKPEIEVDDDDADSADVDGSDRISDDTEDEDEDEDEEDEEEEEEEEEEDDPDLVGGMVFEIPDAKQAFWGITNKETCRIYSTTTCFVQVTARPFVVVPYRDIELVYLERVGFNPPLKHFDMVLVRKDYLEHADVRNAITTIQAIPTSSLEHVIQTLKRYGIQYYNSRSNFRWKPLLEEITEDPERFEKEGGWKSLNPVAEEDVLEPMPNESGSDDESDWAAGEDESSDEEYMYGVSPMRPHNKRAHRSAGKKAAARKPSTIESLQRALAEAYNDEAAISSPPYHRNGKRNQRDKHTARKKTGMMQ